MFSSEVLGLEEVCPSSVIVNWKLHEIFLILTVAGLMFKIFPILTVAGLMFKLYRKEQS